MPLQSPDLYMRRMEITVQKKKNVLGVAHHSKLEDRGV